MDQEREQASANPAFSSAESSSAVRSVRPAVDDISVILATDCGSTTTKAILIEKVGGEYRQTYRGEAPTTVEEPAADVTVGVINAAREIEELSGRSLVDEHNQLIRPAVAGRGCDLYVSTSSAGGGLQMLVCGVVRQMSAASAERAAYGAGAIVMETIASNDRRLPYQKIQRIRDLRPDMILLAGGTTGGTVKHIAGLAELIAPAKPQPRFGVQFRMPLVYAGNPAAAAVVAETLGDEFAVVTVPNLRPTLDEELLNPARDAIHDLFLEHVMAHAPGYDKLLSWTDAPVMPTPGAVGAILAQIAERRGVNAVGVDIGGATTDVFSVFDGQFNRTVSANLGMSYSISNVCAEATLPQILRWVPYETSSRELRNRIKNKMIRPTTIPSTREALQFEQAVAREALRLSYVQHKQFAVSLTGVKRSTGIANFFAESAGPRSLVDNMRLDLLVGSGGVLSHAPRMEQTLLMLLDAFEPEGITQLAKDSIFMMPHLGVLAAIHPRAALEVFDRDCLVMLGTCIAPRGRGPIGSVCCEYRISGGGRELQGTIVVGDVQRIELAVGQRMQVTLQPARGFDVGAGSGRPLTREIEGGTVGIVLDGRGRPLVLPDDPVSRRAAVERWNSALGVY